MKQNLSAAAVMTGALRVNLGQYRFANLADFHLEFFSKENYKKRKISNAIHIFYFAIFNGHWPIIHIHFNAKFE